MTDSESHLVLTVEELAAALRIGRNSAYELVRRNEIAHLRIGRSIRIPVGALREYIDHCAAPVGGLHWSDG